MTDASGAEGPMRLRPRLVRRAAWGIAFVALVAAWVLHEVPERSAYRWSDDPILIIGVSHALLFAVAGLLAVTRPRTAASLLVVGSMTGPWSAILADPTDPLHGAYLFIVLASIVMASLLLPAVQVAGIGAANGIGILVAQWFHPAAGGLHITALLMVLVFTILLATARSMWDADRDALNHRAQQLQEAMRTLQESEHRFRSLSQAAMEGVAIHQQGRIVESNQAFADMFGYRIDEVVGMSVDELVHPDSMAAVRAHMEKRLDDRYEIRLLRRNGQVFWGEAVGRDIPFRGEPMRVVVVRDLTVQREASEAARRAMEQSMEVEKMREVDAMRRRFLNTASHELNTPLTPMLLQTKLLAQRLQGGPPEAVASLQMIQRNTERLALLVRDILDVARIDAGELKLEKKRIDLPDLVSQEVHGMMAMAEENGIVLGLQTRGDAWVQGDSVRIGQVVTNLLSNAVKFTPSGGKVSVLVTARGDTVVLEVRDTGRGFDPALAPRLFKPFSQLHDNDPVVGGTGLGLYICKGIIEAHGGTIEGSSRGEGKGARFLVCLPAGAA